MPWCSCQNTDLDSHYGDLVEGAVICNSCGNRKDANIMVTMLCEEVRLLKMNVEMLQFDKMEKERIEQEERIEEENFRDKLEGESRRFGMMDL